MAVHVASGPGDVAFGFEQQRVGKAFGVSVAAHVVLLVLVGLITQFRAAEPPAEGTDRELLSESIVWLYQEGPGGGGGGGGNETPAPPREAEIPGEDELTVPVEETPELDNPLEDAPEPEPQQQFNIPARTLASAALDSSMVPGAIRGSGPPLSLGRGVGGGAGTGRGTGIGSGTGSGFGEGTGGGTGGGVFRPGSGVDLPRLLRQVDPQYTTDAMRAKIQGVVEIECVVEVTGTCSRIRVVRSLDRTFGLDQEAIKAVQQWRFTPGEMKGEPVPVLINIELSFTLR